jgi:hypothetical protein
MENNCYYCDGTGRVAVANGPDDFDEINCIYCQLDPEPKE